MAITVDSSARTDLATVKEIFDTSLSDDALAFWLNTASDDVDDVAAAGTNLTTSQLARLEALWAAHYASAQDPRHQSVSGASRSVDYDRQSYAEMAYQIDDTGTLEDKSRPSVDFQVMPDNEQYGDSYYDDETTDYY